MAIVPQLITPPPPMPKEREHELHKKTVIAIAEKLVKQAKACGIVLTIEQRPLQPPAMGNYETVIEVRDAPEVYKAAK